MLDVSLLETRLSIQSTKQPQAHLKTLSPSTIVIALLGHQKVTQLACTIAENDTKRNKDVSGGEPVLVGFTDTVKSFSSKPRRVRVTNAPGAKEATVRILLLFDKLYGTLNAFAKHR